MLTFTQLQQQLAFEIQNRYTKKIFNCYSPVDVNAPIKAFITEIADLVLLDTLVVFRPKEIPPQE